MRPYCKILSVVHSIAAITALVCLNTLLLLAVEKPVFQRFTSDYIEAEVGHYKLMQITIPIFLCKGS